MQTMSPPINLAGLVEQKSRAQQLFRESQLRIYQQTDRMFAWLMIAQWLGGIAAAFYISPKTWIGTTEQVHWHVWAALLLGGAITVLPVFLAFRHPGQTATRHVIAVSQMLMSALLIHLTGGRIETHFHVFGSLAFLAFYRDWRVLTTATVIVAVDHMARGWFWPQSVFGMLTANSWRWVEHAGWVLFEDAFLFLSIRQSLHEMFAAAQHRAGLEAVNMAVEKTVATRTAELTLAHRVMQSREERARQLSAAAPIGIFETDVAGYCLYTNPCWQQITGFSFAASLGDGWQRAVHPEDAAQLFATWECCLRAGGELDVEFRFRRPSGEARWIHARAAGVRSESGDLTGYVGTTVDITERRLAETKLAANEQRLRSILAAEPECVKLVARDGSLLDMNPAGLAMIEADSLEQVMGQSCFPLIAPEHRARFQELNTAVFQGESRISEFEIIGRKGTRRWMESHACPLRDAAGEIYAQLAVSRDVTARKQSESELRSAHQELVASEQRFSSAFEYAAIGMALVSLTGRWLKVNRALCDLMGYAGAEFLGKTFQELTHPDDLAADLEKVQQMLAGEIQSYQMEKRYFHKQGQIVWVLLSVSMVRDEQGEPVHFISQIQDISQRKLAEAEAEKANRELVEASRQAGMAEVATGVLHNVGNVLNSVNVAATCVADGLRKSRAGNLAKVAALLREHQADLGTFMVHDSKGKMIPGYLAQLAEHLVNEQTVALAELAQLQKNIEHIKDIVSMQQSFAKVSGGSESVQVTDLVEDALRMNATALHRHDIQIVKEFGAVPPVTVQKHKVLQLLVNLVRNAKHACEDSGRDDKLMTLRVMNGTDRVRISITDNGVGIPPENLTRIFSHGFTTKKNGHGFGLHSGAIAIQEMGGAIKVHSAGVGQGATFTVELPIQPAEEYDV